MLSSDAVNTSTTPDYVSSLSHYCRGCGPLLYPYSSSPVSFELFSNTDPAAKFGTIPNINMKVTISLLNLHHIDLLTSVRYQSISYKSMRGIFLVFFVVPQNYTFQILID